jgi:hypothetical protein
MTKRVAAYAANAGDGIDLTPGPFPHGKGNETARVAGGEETGFYATDA